MANVAKPQGVAASALFLQRREEYCPWSPQALGLGGVCTIRAFPTDAISVPHLIQSLTQLSRRCFLSLLRRPRWPIARLRSSHKSSKLACASSYDFVILGAVKSGTYSKSISRSLVGFSSPRATLP